MHRIALVFMVLPLALAACGGSQYGTAQRTLTPKASVQQAAAKTSDVTSLRVGLSATGSAGMFNGTVTGKGGFDNANHRGSFHLDVSEYGSFDLVVDGKTAYLKAPFLKMFLPAGKTWLKLDGANVNAKVVPQDPKEALARLKKVAAVTVVGDETIDGVTTTHYHGTGRLGHGTFDVWIGKDDGYVRRLGAEESGQYGNGHVLANFSDFNEPVEVAAPPASETVSAKGVTKNFMKLFKRG
jgi:hypothetical protein